MKNYYTKYLVINDVRWNDTYFALVNNLLDQFAYAKHCDKSAYSKLKNGFKFEKSLIKAFEDTQKEVEQVFNFRIEECKDLCKKG